MFRPLLLTAAFLMFGVMQAAYGAECTPSQIEKMIDKGWSKKEIKDFCGATKQESGSAPATENLTKDIQPADNGQADFAKGEAARNKKDLTAAAKWYRIAADKGNVDGQIYLGSWYAGGFGGLQKDLVESVKWWRKAADQGNTLALCTLGIMHKKGDGVTQDKAEGMKMMQKAAVQGDEMCADLIRQERDLEKLESENEELKKHMNDPLKFDDSAGGLNYLKTHPKK